MAEPDTKTSADDEEARPDRQRAAKGGVVHTLLIGMGLTLVVAVGTLAGQLLHSLVSGHSGATPAHEEESAAKPPAKGKAEVKKDPQGPPLYHAFEPLVVNFDEAGQLRFLQVTLEIMTRDPKTVAAVEANTPVLRNNLLLLVSSRDMKQLMTREGKEELRTLAREDLGATLRKLSPDSEIEDVYFTSFVMQ